MIFQNKETEIIYVVEDNRHIERLRKDENFKEIKEFTKKKQEEKPEEKKENKTQSKNTAKRGRKKKAE